MTGFKKIFAFFLVLLFFCSSLYSQDFEDFKKKMSDKFDSFDQSTDDKFETFKKKTQLKFDNFVVKMDEEFSSYLGNSFDSYMINNERLKPSTPKPTTIPVANEVEVSGDLINYELIEVHTTYQGPVYPGIKKIEVNEFETQKIDVDFLGWPLYFNLDKAFFNISIDGFSASDIGSFWSESSNYNYNHFLYQISEVSANLNINQWGYYQLLKLCSEEIYPLDANMQILFQWAMLTRSRYKVKVGFSSDNIYLLLPSVFQIYGVDYVKIQGVNYYIIDGNGKEIETYAMDFPESDILMDLCIKRPFNTNPIKKSKNYSFEYNKKKYTVRLDFDEQMINFYKTIPLSDISIYFNSVVSERTKLSIKKAFKPILKGKSDVEAANILLAFVQYAFDYKTDQQAYGKERYFFADELLHYPYADCEDRSVLFAYLVSNLLNKEVTALSFPGHMATAINFDSEVNGMHFEHNEKSFVVADPTFYGAPVGLILPDVSAETAKVLVLNSNTYKTDIAQKVWANTKDFGGFKADKLNDVAFDAIGNVYVCGYFINSANFSGNVLKAYDSHRDVFIVKYDSDLNLVWVRSATGSGSDMAFSIALESDGSIYVYGSLENELNFGDVVIQANDAPDVFIAKYSKDGDLIWVKKAGIDKIDHSLDFMFAAKFTPEGEKIMAKLYSQSEDFDYYGINLDKKGNALIKGSFFATSGMNTNDYVNYNIGSDLDIPEVLHKTDIKLKESEYEATIAGLFSALNLLKANTIEIQGSQIKTTFDTYNNNFKNYASGIYSRLSDMKFLKNEKGIVTIKSNDGKPIILKNIKIDDGAKLRIVKYKSGNILVEALAGIYVGGDDYWLVMNSIKLFKESGDLLFDYDADNSVQKLNLKAQILNR